MKKQFIFKTISLVILIVGAVCIISCDNKEIEVVETSQVEKNLTQEKAEEIINAYHEYGKNVFLDWRSRNKTEFPNSAFENQEFSEYLRKNMLEEASSGTGFLYDLDVSFQSLEEVGENLIVPVLVTTRTAFVLKPNMIVDFLENDEIIESSGIFKYFYVFDKESHKIKNVYVPLPNYAPNSKTFSESDIERMFLLWKEDRLIQKKKELGGLDEITKEYLEGEITQEEAIERGHLLQKQTNYSKKNPRSYNAQDAVDYALNYVYNYNTSFTSYGNDCTNFISQCLLTGGFSFVDGSSTSCKTWWYDNNGTSTTSDDTASQTWSTANGLKRYLSYCNTATLVYDYDDARYGSPANSQKGDISFWDFDNDGVYTHATIITYAWQWNWQSSRDVRFTYHTNDRKNIKISNSALDGLPDWNPVFVRI